MKHHCLIRLSAACLVALSLLSPRCHAQFAWDTFAIHGFLSQGFLQSTDNDVFAETRSGTFQFNEFGVNLATDLTENLHVGLQLFSRDLGDLGNNTIQLDWGYASYRWKDWLGVQAGRIKSASGLYMEIIDLDMLRSFIFLPQSVYDESMRDIFIAVNGIGAYGYVPLGPAGDLTYQAVYGAINLSTDGSMAVYMESEANARLIDVEDQPLLRAHIEWMPPGDGVRIVGSLIRTDIHLRYVTTDETYWAIQNGIPAGWEFPHIMEDATILTGGIEWMRDRVTLQAEYEYLEASTTHAVEEPGLYRSAGYYAAATYRVTDRWTVGAYYSVYYDDLDDRDGRRFERDEGLPRYYQWQNDLTLSTRLDITDQWALKGEVHWLDGTALLLNQYNPDGPARESMFVALKTTFNF